MGRLAEASRQTVRMPPAASLPLADGLEFLLRVRRRDRSARAPRQPEEAAKDGHRHRGPCAQVHSCIAGVYSPESSSPRAETRSNSANSALDAPGSPYSNGSTQGNERQVPCAAAPLESVGQLLPVRATPYERSRVPSSGRATHQDLGRTRVERLRNPTNPGSAPDNTAPACEAPEEGESTAAALQRATHD